MERLTAVAPLASAAILSVLTPALDSGFLTVADRQMETAVNDVHLRSNPSTNSTKLATLKIGTKVTVVEMVAKVMHGAKSGYIRADLLK